MTPTPKLRFVERDDETSWTPKTVRILQQWCEDHNNILHSTRTNETEWVNHYAGEWRDVPLEAET